MCASMKLKNTECSMSKISRDWGKMSEGQQKTSRNTDVPNATWNLQHQSCVICTSVRSISEPKISVSAIDYLTHGWTVNSVPSPPSSPSNSDITWPESTVTAALQPMKIKTVMIIWKTTWLLTMTPELKLAMKTSSCSKFRTARLNPTSVLQWPSNCLCGTAWLIQSQ